MVNYTAEIINNNISIKSINNDTDIFLDRDVQFCDIDNYDIFAEIYKCIFTDTNGDIPIMYMKIIYNRKILVGSNIR